MSKTKLILDQEKYIPEEYNQDEIGVLSFLLAYHIRNNHSFFSDWLEGERSCCSTNRLTGSCGFIKRFKNNIYVGLTFDSGKGRAVTVKKTVKEFKRLLGPWYELYRKKPKEIIIEKDEDEIIIRSGTSIKITSQTRRYIFDLAFKEAVFESFLITKFPGFHHINKEAMIKEFGEDKASKKIKDGKQFILKNYHNSGEDLIIEIIKHIPKTGVFLSKIKYGGAWGKPKVFFPISWSQKKVIKKIWHAYKNPTHKLMLNNNKYVVYGLTNENITIKMTIDRETMVAAHPEMPLITQK